MSVLQGAIIIVLSSLIGFGSCIDIYSTVKYVFKKDDPDIKGEKTRHSISEKWLEEIRVRKKNETDQKEAPALQIIPELQENNFEKTDSVAHKKVEPTQKVENAGKIVPDYKMQKPETPTNISGVNSLKQSQTPPAPKSTLSEKSKAKTEKVKQLPGNKVQISESPENMSAVNGFRVSQLPPAAKISISGIREKSKPLADNKLLRPESAVNKSDVNTNKIFQTTAADKIQIRKQIDAGKDYNTKPLPGYNMGKLNTAKDEKSKLLADNKLKRPESAVNKSDVNSHKIPQTTAADKIQIRKQIDARKDDDTKPLSGYNMHKPDSPVNTSVANNVKQSQAPGTGKMQLRKLSETGKDGKTKTYSQSPGSTPGNKTAASNIPKRVQTQVLKTQMGEQRSSKTLKPNRIKQFQSQANPPNQKHPSITLQNIQQGSVKSKVQYWNLLSSSESKETDM